MTYHDQGQNELENPFFRHGQMKENLVIVVRRSGKGLVNGLGGLGRLLIEEFTADPVILGQPTDRFGLSQDLQ